MDYEQRKQAGETWPEIFGNSPSCIGKYSIRGKLGQGGMGVVYRAYDPDLKREVALKTILQDSDPVIIKRFQREAETMSKLSHPHIVKVYEVGNVKGCPYFTMEFIEGKTLAEWSKEEKIPVARVLELVKKVARAIQYAHSHGILHRDIKPSNILLDSTGEPKVMDFGLALDVARETRFSNTGGVLGTPAYMPPEQALGKKRELDVRSDVYSLGAVLYELLTGIPAFHGSGPQILKHVVENDPLPPSRIAPRVPRKLDNICLKAMAKEKERRYQTAEELAQDLERFREKAPVAAVGLGTRYRLQRWGRKNRLILGMAGGLVSVAVVVLLAVMGRWRYLDREHAKILEHEQQAKNKAEELKTSSKSKVSKETPSPLEDAVGSQSQVGRRNFMAAVINYNHGNFLDSQGDPDGAIAAYTKAIALDPELGEAYYNRGMLRRQKGLEQDAIADFTKAIEVKPGLEQSYYNRAEMRYNRNELDVAISDYNKAIELAPNLTRNYVGRGNTWHKKGETERAIADYTRAIAINPSHADAYFNRGQMLDMLKNYAGAAADYTKAIMLKPDDSIIYARRAMSRYLTGDIEGAGRDVDKAVELNPNLAEAYFVRGALLYAKGDVDGAIQAENQTIALDPKHTQAYYSRGALYAFKEDWARAIADCNKTIAQSPTHVEAYSNRGYARMMQGDADGAIADCTNAIALRPDYVEAYTNRAGARALKKDLDGAIKDCNKALALAPNHAEAYRHRSVARAAQGDLDGAIKDCNQTIKLNQGWAEAYKTRAEILEQKGDTADALADLRMYLKLKPNASDAAKIQAYLKKYDKVSDK